MEFKKKKIKKRPLQNTLQYVNCTYHFSRKHTSAPRKYPRLCLNVILLLFPKNNFKKEHIMCITSSCLILSNKTRPIL